MDILGERQKMVEARKEVEDALKEKVAGELDLEKKSLGVRKLMNQCFFEQENQDRNNYAENGVSTELANDIAMDELESKRMENRIEELFVEYASKGQAYKTHQDHNLSSFWTLVNQNQICEDVDEEIRQLETDVSQTAQKHDSLTREIDTVILDLETDEDLGLSFDDVNLFTTF
ncbi:unnamed protein product [Allacma fusca]|uniref:Uncharacterized protein n=1 Tax=Allacma fusca TaxID=39272 RepID=A0A8J2JQ45_9HEXA|nr:unnamed protein product [Allacma fusca]